MVDGVEVILTEEEEAALRAEWAVNQAQAAIDAKKRQIASLEKQITPRRIREALLSNDKSFIQDIDNQITTLRNQL